MRSSRVTRLSGRQAYVVKAANFHNMAPDALVTMLANICSVILIIRRTPQPGTKRERDGVSSFTSVGFLFSYFYLFVKQTS